MIYGMANGRPCRIWLPQSTWNENTTSIMKSDMKRQIGTLVLAVASIALLNGCVPVTYTKTVTVHKNPSGQVTEIVEVESITEPHSETPRIVAKPSAMPFEHLK